MDYRLTSTVRTVRGKTCGTSTKTGKILSPYHPPASCHQINAAKLHKNTITVIDTGFSIKNYAKDVSCSEKN